MKIIDLRRDTITQPDIKMKEEAFKVKLGDSVYGEDPKQKELEEFAAWKMGKDESIFVPSGTMGNLTALLTHTERGNEIILEENAHIRTSESGGAACVGGLMIKTVKGNDGAPEPDGIALSIRPDNIHYPKTSLICLENTHYRYGGIVPPIEKFRQIRKISKKYNIPIHLDGARIFNACTYLGLDVKEITKYVDSVMVSLSKGLGAPVGSVLCGSSKFIKKAKRYRKMLGGGMRQTGWLCACGLIALSFENIKKLKEDHENARLLAEGLSSIPYINVDCKRVQTNFVIADLENTQFDAFFILSSIKEKGVLATQAGKYSLRFVTSREVNREDIIYAIDVIKESLSCIYQK